MCGRVNRADTKLSTSPRHARKRRRVWRSSFRSQECRRSVRRRGSVPTQGDSLDGARRKRAAIATQVSPVIDPSESRHGDVRRTGELYRRVLHMHRLRVPVGGARPKRSAALASQSSHAVLGVSH
ncbi:hypothetical protein BD413DRAFT_513616 [Trametes elegans]|nr:hypothetical protein BD413DRAFT_513616 [Trametes elegans]